VTNLKKIKRVNVFSYSAPDDIAEKLKKVTGKKSDVITAALRKHFAEEEGKTPEEIEQVVAAGLTLTDIKKRIEDYMLELNKRFHKELRTKIEEAKDRDDWGAVGSYRAMLDDLRGFCIEADKEPQNPVDIKVWMKTLTMKDLEAIFGITYQKIYNKIVPLLLKEGYNVVKKRKYGYY
jgi:hypothetical protein